MLAVILFHFDVKALSGGFLGVDIFFVISGYLITLHIRQQVGDGSFSFLNFYARRIRRLFPALAVTLVFTSIAAVFLLPERMLQQYAHSAIASSVYLSNAYFWSVAGYFDLDSIYKPLLHTWSLSVEEQFYIFWPLAIVLFARRYLTLAIIFAGIASFLIGFHPAFSPVTTFYHFPFRVHEFALGALMTSVSLTKLPRWLGAVAVVAALAAIGWGLVTTTPESHFPGWGSGAVVIGTALIIAAANPLLNTDWFAMRPIRHIGLTSYSVYLVHWPLVVFYKILFPGPLAPLEIAVLLTATLVLAEISYRLVEQPAARISLPRYRFAVIALAPLMLIGAIAFNATYPQLRAAIQSNTNTGADQEAVNRLLDTIPDREATLTAARQEIAANATGVPAAGRKTIAVVGDSHADDTRYALRLVLGDDKANIVLIHSICDPLTIESIAISMEELYRTHSQDKTREPGFCQPVHEALIANIQAAEPDVIIFSEAWRHETLPYLPATIEQVKAAVPAKIIILGRIPQLAGMPDVIFRNVPSLAAINSVAWDRRYTIFDDMEPMLAGIASDAGVSFVSKANAVCPDKLCDIVIASEIGYTDPQHWSVAGMKFYGARLVSDPVFRAALEP